MTEKHSYAAKIRTKGCDNTGITQDIAKSMFNSLGRTTYGIVALEHRRQVNDDEQGRSVELEPTVEQVIAAKAAAEAIDPDQPHEYVPGDADTCELCELGQTAGIHEPQPVPA